jgi:hypothetical protein
MGLTLSPAFAQPPALAEIRALAHWWPRPFPLMRVAKGMRFPIGPCLRAFCANRRAGLAGSWRMMKRISRSKAPGNKRYPGGNKERKTVGVLLTVRRDKVAALRFVDKAMKASGVPEKVTMGRRGASERWS